MLPLAAILAAHSSNTSRVLCSGWMPLILAMLISSLSGFVFARSERRFQHIAVFQPIINGTGSNLIAVQVSRISTYLHQRSEKGQLSVFVIEKNVVNEKKTSKLEWIRHCLFRPYRAFIGDSKSFLYFKIREINSIFLSIDRSQRSHCPTVAGHGRSSAFNIFDHHLAYKTAAAFQHFFRRFVLGGFFDTSKFSALSQPFGRAIVVAVWS